MAEIEFIQRNYLKLSKAISPNVESIVAILYSEGVVNTQHMRDAIIEDNNNPKHKKAWALLDLILMQGSRALDHLYNAVVEERMFEAADILKPGIATHEGNMAAKPKPETKEYDSPDEDLPDYFYRVSDTVQTAIMSEEHAPTVAELKEKGALLGLAGDELRKYVQEKERIWRAEQREMIKAREKEERIQLAKMESDERIKRADREHELELRKLELQSQNGSSDSTSSPQILSEDPKPSQPSPSTAMNFPLAPFDESTDQMDNFFKI